MIRARVLLPYRFTLFSNHGYTISVRNPFYYLIDLHYSQTQAALVTEQKKFYYLIDLHYSQTILTVNHDVTGFYYLIDLHYSQTS